MNTRSPRELPRPRIVPWRIATAITLFLGAAHIVTAADWESKIEPFTPGDFPELRPLRATYEIGWNGVPAATAEIRHGKSGEGQFQLDAVGGTIGVARALWPYNVKHTAISNARTLRPVEVRESEKVRSKEFDTRLTFDPAGVTSEREERKGSSRKSKTRKFSFPTITSLNSALLYLRTKPLETGAVHHTVVYPATSAYLCTITVMGRERITVPAGEFDAIKVDVHLVKIGKDRQLQPHKRVRKSTVWLSDDKDRLVLRAESQVFVGTVYAELRSVQFENSIKP